jgi:hypothetical protein
MNKRVTALLAIFIIISIFTGCKMKSTDLPIARKKPSNFYYTSILANNMAADNNIKGSVFEINLHKEKELGQEGYESILVFFKSLKSRNFINKPADLPAKPQYKFYITSKNEKYVINIFNEKYISIHPWDGIYIDDYIDISDINTRYSLYELCKYFFK